MRTLLIVALLLQLPVGAVAENPFGLAEAPEAIEPGTRTGHLSWPADSRDDFVIDVPARAIVGAYLNSSEWLYLEVEGPVGSEDVYAGGYASASAPEGGQIRIRVVLLERTEATYELTVTLEVREHAQRLHGGGALAAAWRIHAHPGQPTRYEISYDLDGLQASRHGTVMQSGYRDATRCIVALQPWIGWSGHDQTVGALNRPDGQAAWVRLGPDEVTVERPPHEVDDPVGLVGYWPGYSRVDVENASFTREVGVAHPSGVNHVAWVLWDGPEAAVEAVPGAEAHYLRLRDFQGGFAAQGGHVAWAGGMTAHVPVTGPENGTRLLLVDATRPELTITRANLGVAALDVETPSGERIELRNEAAIWSDLQTWWGEDRGAPEAGIWRVDLRHVDGWEGDHVRVGSVHFPFGGCDET